VKALAEVYSSAPATRSLSHGPSTDALWRTTTKDLPQMPPSLPRTSSTCQTAPFRDAQGSLDRYDVRRDQAIPGWRPARSSTLLSGAQLWLLRTRPTPYHDPTLASPTEEDQPTTD
jgi:hypothetical protein